MKKLFLLLMLLIPFTIFSQKFTIVKATKQRWVGGRPETGSGINYKIYLIPKMSSKKLFLDSIWLNKKVFAIDRFIIKNQYSDKFEARDTIVILMNDHFPGKFNSPNIDTENDTIVKEVFPPIKYKGAALIKFHTKCKTDYLIIEKFDELQPLAYP